MAVNPKILTRVHYKTATIRQQYHFVLMSKHSDHLKIFCRFSKVEDP